MRTVYRMLTARIVVAGLILLPVFQVFAESIYHWKDDNGVSCYSNISTPKGETKFSIISAGWPALSEVEAPDLVEKTDEDVAETAMADSSDAVSDSRTSVLRSRIEHRRTSIQRIENLLKKHPGDSELRKSLFHKKQYLNEDMVRLKLLAK